MGTQFIEKGGKKEYAVIPYKEFLRMQQSLEDYADLQALRAAKAEPGYKKRRPFEDVAKEIDLMK